MALEIERKFLVCDDSYRNLACTKSRIKQGYICSEYDRTVRVRICDSKGFLTIKGKSDESGLKRYEWEHEIPLLEAEELLLLCETGVIDKIRYRVKYASHVFEVDEFYGENKGLVVAEVELESEEEEFLQPAFLGKEVTGQIKYYNSSLRKYPYTKWDR